MLISGKADCGESYLACAFGDQACRQGRSTRYFRGPRLFAAPTIAHGDGSYPRLLASLTQTGLMILDDFAPGSMGAPTRVR